MVWALWRQIGWNWCLSVSQTPLCYRVHISLTQFKPPALVRAPVRTQHPEQGVTHGTHSMIGWKSVTGWKATVDRHDDITNQRVFRNAGSALCLSPKKMRKTFAWVLLLSFTGNLAHPRYWTNEHCSSCCEILHLSWWYFHTPDAKTRPSCHL